MITTLYVQPGTEPPADVPVTEVVGYDFADLGSTAGGRHLTCRGCQAPDHVHTWQLFNGDDQVIACSEAV